MLCVRNVGLCVLFAGLAGCASLAHRHAPHDHGVAMSGDPFQVPARPAKIAVPNPFRALAASGHRHDGAGPEPTPNVTIADPTAVPGAEASGFAANFDDPAVVEGISNPEPLTMPQPPTRPRFRIGWRRNAGRDRLPADNSAAPEFGFPPDRPESSVPGQLGSELPTNFDQSASLDRLPSLPAVIVAEVEPTDETRSAVEKAQAQARLQFAEAASRDGQARRVVGPEFDDDQPVELVPIEFDPPTRPEPVPTESTTPIESPTIPSEPTSSALTPEEVASILAEPFSNSNVPDPSPEPESIAPSPEPAPTPVDDTGDPKLLPIEAASPVVEVLGPEPTKPNPDAVQDRVEIPELLGDPFASLVEPVGNDSAGSVSVPHAPVAAPDGSALPEPFETPANATTDLPTIEPFRPSAGSAESVEDGFSSLEQPESFEAASPAELSLSKPPAEGTEINPAFPIERLRRQSLQEVVPVNPRPAGAGAGSFRVAYEPELIYPISRRLRPTPSQRTRSDRFKEVSPVSASESAPVPIAMASRRSASEAYPSFTSEPPVPTPISLVPEVRPDGSGTSASDSRSLELGRFRVSESRPRLLARLRDRFRREPSTFDPMSVQDPRASGPNSWNGE